MGTPPAPLQTREGLCPSSEPSSLLLVPFCDVTSYLVPAACALPLFLLLLGLVGWATWQEPWVRP